MLPPTSALTPFGMLPVSRVNSKDYVRSSSRKQSPVYHNQSLHSTQAPHPIRIRVARDDSHVVRVTLPSARGRSSSPAHSHYTRRRTTTQAVQTEPDLDAALEGMKDDLTRSHQDASALRDRSRLLEKALRDAREIIRKRDAEIERLQKELARAVDEQKKEREESRRKVEEGRRTVEALLKREREGRELAPKRSFHAPARPEMPVPRKAWSEAETRARTQSLEVFCTKTDDWSGADVCEAVRDLNSEVLQFAAGVSELCAGAAPAKAKAAKSPDAIRDTAGRLGAAFVRVLATRDNSQDPILVQFALQSCLSTCIARFFSSFCPGLSSKYDMLLCQIYEHMQGSLPQATSSRWRALTHRHIRALYRNVEEHALNELASTILRWTTDLLTTAGCHTAQSTLSSPAVLRTRFGPQLRRIVLAVGKLAQVTREEILSTNFEVGTVPEGTPYDPQEMCDAAEPEYGGGRAGKVLCCTELGLRCTTRKDAEDAEAAQEMEQTLLLKPKVVLESVVPALDR